MNDKSGIQLVNLATRVLEPMRGKSQVVRLVDVFALGPFMVWYAYRSNKEPGWARAVLAFSGVLTSVYNGANYLKVRQEEQRAKAQQTQR